MPRELAADVRLPNKYTRELIEAGTAGKTEARQDHFSRRNARCKAFQSTCRGSILLYGPKSTCSCS